MKRTIAALALLVAQGQMVTAQGLPPGLITADPSQLAALIAGQGYPVEETTDDIGDPQLIVKSEGTNFYVQFYGCGADHLTCSSIQFLAAFDMADGLDAEKTLSWMREQRFTSVYLDDDRDPFLQMDVNLDGGVAVDNLTDTLEIWRAALSSFKDYIDW